MLKFKIFILETFYFIELNKLCVLLLEIVIFSEFDNLANHNNMLSSHQNIGLMNIWQYLS